MRAKRVRTECRCEGGWLQPVQKAVMTCRVGGIVGVIYIRPTVNTSPNLNTCHAEVRRVVFRHLSLVHHPSISRLGADRSSFDKLHDRESLNALGHYTLTPYSPNREKLVLHTGQRLLVFATG
jgi:hypothetical protein